MSIHSLADRREANRAAADKVFAEIEQEIIDARDDIMTRALRRVSAVDPQATVGPVVERLGALWCAAWPLGRQGVPD